MTLWGLSSGAHLSSPSCSLACFLWNEERKKGKIEGREIREEREREEKRERERQEIKRKGGERMREEEREQKERASSWLVSGLAPSLTWGLEQCKK